jgi:hypothetical protein
MQTKPLLALLFVACSSAGGPSSPHAPSAPSSPAASAPASPPAPHASAVDALVGVWLGTGDTPMGDIPIALAFDRAGDGAVQARLDGPGGMYLAFRFHRDGGRWLLAEEGYIPGAGVQRHVLVPAAPGARWVDQDDATVLAVTLDVDDRTLVFATELRGAPHAVFRLARVTGGRADEVRRRIAASAAAGVSSP